MNDWLANFVQYTSYGEASPRLMFWVGVATIAGALRRKVWIQEEGFQWAPNFYILIVGEPGSVRKTTSMDRGLWFLKQLEIDTGPDSVTWQALIEHIAQRREPVIMPDGEVFEMSCVTLAISEFGTFFDPMNRDLKDNMTALWDNRIGSIQKMTKTAGNDIMVNPWVNLIAGTTPTWVAKNFGEDMVGAGLASRFVFLREKMPDRDIPYPSREIKHGSEHRAMGSRLLDQLGDIAEYKGEAKMSEEAYLWGDAWYREERSKLRAGGISELERDFLIRKQGHLHKLAIVVSASRGEFPVITKQHLLAAHEALADLEKDARDVFDCVGQTKITNAARAIADEVAKRGEVPRRVLYQQRFFRTMTVGEYNEAVNSAVQAELICEMSDVAKPLLVKRP